MRNYFIGGALLTGLVTAGIWLNKESQAEPPQKDNTRFLQALESHLRGQEQKRQLQENPELTQVQLMQEEIKKRREQLTKLEQHATKAAETNREGHKKQAEQTQLREIAQQLQKQTADLERARAILETRIDTEIKKGYERMEKPDEQTTKHLPIPPALPQQIPQPVILQNAQLLPQPQTEQPQPKQQTEQPQMKYHLTPVIYGQQPDVVYAKGQTHAGLVITNKDRNQLTKPKLLEQIISSIKTTQTDDEERLREMAQAYERILHKYNTDEKLQTEYPQNIIEKEVVKPISKGAYKLIQKYIEDGKQWRAKKAGNDFRAFLTLYQQRMLQNKYAKEFKEQLYTSMPKTEIKDIPIANLFTHKEYSTHNIAPWQIHTWVAHAIAQGLDPFTQIPVAGTVFNVPRNIAESAGRNVFLGPEANRALLHPQDSGSNDLKVLGANTLLGWGIYRGFWAGNEASAQSTLVGNQSTSTAITP